MHFILFLDCLTSQHDDVQITFLQAPTNICVRAVLWSCLEDPLEGHDGCWVTDSMFTINSCNHGQK